MSVVEKTTHPLVELKHQIDVRESEFKAALPAHIPVERFKRVIMTAVQNNLALLNADRRSFINAAMRAAQDGLLPDGREGAIVIYRTKQGNDWIEAAQWMPMIAGVRKKVRNSGEIATWDAQVVYANDEFAYELGDDPFVRHKPKLDGERGAIIAAYSIATLKTGEKSREVMSVEEIESVRARSRSKDKGPWVTDYAEMCRKTVARRHSKMLPMSTDLDDLVRRDDALYDFEGRGDAARQEAPAPRVTSLNDRLDRLAAGPSVQIDHVAHNEDGVIEDETQKQDSDAAPAQASGSGAAADPHKPSSAAAPDTHTSGDDFPGDKPSKIDPLQVARERGAAAFAGNFSRRALPPEYRDGSREAEKAAWLEGFDAATAATKEG